MLFYASANHHPTVIINSFIYFNSHVSLFSDSFDQASNKEQKKLILTLPFSWHRLVIEYIRLNSHDNLFRFLYFSFIGNGYWIVEGGEKASKNRTSKATLSFFSSWTSKLGTPDREHEAWEGKEGKSFSYENRLCFSSSLFRASNVK